ncbi:MAG: HD domain-containing protein [Clostridium sp.]|nr:HD domain-containing protein [Clostridium sp.]
MRDKSEKYKKHVEKIRKQYEQRREFYLLLKENASDILNSENFRSTRNYIQHGSIPVQRHCMDVAAQSIAISNFLGIECSKRELIRGALLHDYFLYDWHDKTRENYRRLHGFYHPGIALENAEKEYHLTLREKDIIKKHMWPLTFFPPLCREAWIVTAADKYCSLLETLRLRKGNVANVRKTKVRTAG